MKFVETDDLQDLALGAALLGSGGGGCPDYELLMAEKHLMEHGPVELTDVASLLDTDLVLPIAFVGAPLVAMEMLPSGAECELLLDTVHQVTGKRPTHLMPAEIGGANSLCPFLYAAKLRLPVLDADAIGRAFPEMQMSTCNLFGISANPAILVDTMGNVQVIREDDACAMERMARGVIVEMGSSALAGVYLMHGKQGRQAVVKGSVSLAMGLGRSIREAKSRSEDPLLPLTKNYGAKILGTGIIDNIDQCIEEGFLKGTVSILSVEDSIDIDYQNEYLRVQVNGITVASTPEIITLVDSESCKPIASEKLLYGTRVIVMVLPSPAIWMTEKGLKLVGPAYFGFKDAKQIGEVV